MASQASVFSSQSRSFPALPDLPKAPSSLSSRSLATASSALDSLARSVGSSESSGRTILPAEGDEYLNLVGHGEDGTDPLLDDFRRDADHRGLLEFIYDLANVSGWAYTEMVVTDKRVSYMEIEDDCSKSLADTDAIAIKVTAQVLISETLCNAVHTCDLLWKELSAGMHVGQTVD